jgi:16S rRNA G966 N2-methylase RsmD
MVESDPVIQRALVASRETLAAAAVEVVKADALEFLRSDAAVYDVVFADPPFKAGLWPRLAQLLPPRLAPGALVYYEGAAPPELPPGWDTHRTGRAGQVSYQLLKSREP